MNHNFPLKHSYRQILNVLFVPWQEQLELDKSGKHYFKTTSTVSTQYSSFPIIKQIGLYLSQ